MHENEISKEVVDICYKVHTTLGPGLFESVYEEVLACELRKRNLQYHRQCAIPVFWDGLKLDHGFRADLIVEEEVIIEIKSIETIARVHQKQLLTYLRLTDLRLGLLINFNEALIKNGIQRIVNKL